MNTELMLDVGQANEFKLACRRAGYTNADVKELCKGDTLARLLPVIRGHAAVTHVTHVIDCAADPFIPYSDWKVAEHLNRGQFTWDPAKVKHHLSKNQMNGKRLEGNKLREELANEPTENASLLDYLLDHPHLIPESWKTDEQGNMLYTFFWGTIYQVAIGSSCVRFLYFDAGRWRTDYRLLDGGFDAKSPAARRAS